MKKIIISLLFIFSFLLPFRLAAQGLLWEKLSNPGEVPPIHCTYVDGNTVYVGGQFGSIYRSTDEGLHWEMVDTVWKDTPIRSVFGKDSCLIVFTDSGWYRSFSYGGNWGRIGGASRYRIDYYSILYKDAWITGALNVGTLYTLDSGRSWKGLSVSSTKGYGSQINCFYTCNDTLYIGNDYGVTRVLRGATSLVSESMTNGFNLKEGVEYNVRGFACIEGALFCVTDSGFFRLDRATSRWKKVNELLMSCDIFDGNTVCLQSIGTSIIAGTISGLLRSSDLGQSWHVVGRAINDTIRWLISTGSALIAVSHYGVYRSTDSGETWKPSTAGLTYRLYPVSCFALAAGNIVSGTDGGGVYTSSNGGLSWASFNGGMPSLSTRTLIYRNGITYTGTSNGISANDGGAWFARNDGLPSTSIYSLSASSSGLLVGTERGGMALLNDGDSIWHRRAKNISPHAAVAVASMGSDFFIGTNGDGAFRSSDDGISWQAIADIGDRRVVSFATVGTQLFAGTGGSGVFRSLDSGIYWEAVNTGLTNQKVQALASFGATLFAATDNGVFQSKNQGTNWVQENTGLETFKMASLSVIGLYLYASTNGSGIYRAYLGEPGAVAEPAATSSWMLYPNPATNIVTIANNSGDRPHVAVVIYNILGEKVWEAKTAASNAISIDLHSFVPGRYIVAVADGNTTITHSLIITGHE